MSQLARDIEYLLLDHDQVSVPGLGTFVVSTQALQRDDAGMFYVPRRDVAFRQDACDDGVLAAYVAQRDRCTAEDAQKKVQKHVEDCRLTLEETGVCDLDNLGQMVQDGDMLVFQPCQAGLTSPGFFGLDNMEMPILPLLTTQIQQAVARQNHEEEGKSHPIVIRLNRTLVHYAASIAAGVALFFAYATPTSNTGCDQAALTPGFFIPTEDCPASAIDDEYVEEDYNAEEAVEAPIAIETQKTKAVKATRPASATQTGYAVVVASSIKKANAQAMVERLHAKGFTKAQVYENNNMTRVAFLGYKDYESASSAARELRGMDSELAGAWVYNIK